MVSIKHLTKQRAVHQLLTRQGLFGDLVERQFDGTLLDRGWEDHDAIEVSDDQLAGLHEHLSATHGDVVRHNAPAAHAVDRPDAAEEDREVQTLDPDGIADLAVADTPHSPSGQ